MLRMRASIDGKFENKRIFQSDTMTITDLQRIGDEPKRIARMAGSLAHYEGASRLFTQIINRGQHAQHGARQSRRLHSS